MGAQAYEFNGSAAIAHEAGPRLSVIEGGLGSAASHAREEAPRRAGRPRAGLALATRTRAQSRAAWASAVVLLAAGALVAVVISLGQSAARDARYASLLGSAPEQAVSVAPGDTLTSIAERHSGGSVDTRAVVDWIRERNGIEDAKLVPGQILEVPVLG
ncbi:MAG: LysM peptidoglycan-binding domain-containing protein [Olsenella sp.]|jgi:hypothetical protein